MTSPSYQVVQAVPPRVIMHVGTHDIRVLEDGKLRYEELSLQVYHDSRANKMVKLSRNLNNTMTLYLIDGDRKVEGEDDPYLGFGHDYPSQRYRSL